MSAKRDYYEILGVTKSSTKDEIKKAYRKLAMQFHPDKNPGNKEAEQKFKEASEAAEVLLSDEKKQRYDQFGHAGVDGQAGGFGGGGFGGGDFSDLGDIFGDIFGDFLGGGAGGGRRRSSRSSGIRGDDMQISVNITFEQAAFGIEKEVTLMKDVIKEGTTAQSCQPCRGTGEIRRQQGFFTIAQTCPQCGGQGEVVQKVKKKVNLSVKIPAGIDDGQRLKLSGEGQAGSKGGPSGDLYVLVNVEKHQILERDGFDVYCNVPISFSMAALGGEIEVPTLSGKVLCTVPSGTQSGRKLRLKNKGIQKLGSYGLGDQIVLLNVETPTELNSEQKELFQRLAQLEESHKSTNPISKSFFEKVKELFQ